MKKARKNNAKRVTIVLITIILCLGAAYGQNQTPNHYPDSLQFYSIKLERQDQLGNVLSRVMYCMARTYSPSMSMDSLHGFLFGTNGNNFVVTESTGSGVYFGITQGQDTTTIKIMVSVIKQMLQTTSGGSVSGFLVKLWQLCDSSPVLYLSNDEELHLTFEKNTVNGIQDIKGQERKLDFVQVFDLSGQLLCSSSEDIKLTSLRKGIYVKVSSFSDGKTEMKKVSN